MGQPNINDFHTDLAYSLETVNEKELNSFYLQFFFLAKRVENVTDLEIQKKGIDKFIHCSNGKIISIDEKIRRKDYGDILVETYSNLEQKKYGWIIYSQCDFIAYIIQPTKKLYMLPTTILQKTCFRNYSKWANEKTLKDALNKGYTTRNLSIPTGILLEEMKKTMCQAY